MYTKFGESLYVCSDVGSLPVTSLGLADQVVLLEKSPIMYHRNEHFGTESSSSMILVDIIAECMYVFQGVTTKSSFYVEDSEDFDSHVKKNAGIEYKEQSRTFLNIQRGDQQTLIELPQKAVSSAYHNKQDVIYTETDVRNAADLTYTPDQEKHHLFENLRWSTGSEAKLISSKYENTVVALLSVPIQESVKVVFTVRFHMRPENRSLSMNHVVHIVSDQGSVITLDHVDVELLLNTVRSMKDESESFKVEFEKYNKYYSLSKSSITSAISKNRLAEVQSILFDVFQIANNLGYVTRYTEPFYTCKETGVSAYSDWDWLWNTASPGVVLVHDGVVQFSWDIDKTPFKTDFEVASAILSFLRQGKKGIDPRTGDLYVDGVITMPGPKSLFRCDYGLRYDEGSNIKYYKEVKGHFLLVSPEDVTIVSEIDKMYEFTLTLVGESESHT